MLSYDSIIERVRAREIVIRYYFLPGQDSKIEFIEHGSLVDIDQSQDSSTKFFNSKLYSDRLGLTLGPIVKSHTHTFLTGRKKFRGRSGYFDIRDGGGAFVLAPYETISIATNERVALGERTSALIIPRITLADAGIVLNVAYIDPFWDGTLQMVLSNNTPYSQHLTLLEPIAQCIFFDLSAPAPPQFRENFAAKSHHFGQNWYKVLVEEAEPLPQRKRPQVTPRGIVAWRGVLSRIWLENKHRIQNALVIVLLLVGVASVYSVSGSVSRLPEMERKVTTMYPYFEKSGLNLPSIQGTVTDLQERVPITGSEVLTLPAGATQVDRTISVSRQLRGPGLAVAQANRDTDISASAIILGTTERTVRLRLRALARTPSTFDRDVFVSWALIP